MLMAMASTMTVAAAPQATQGTTAGSSRHYVVIGCVSQDVQPRLAQTAGNPPGFVLTDIRGERLSKYRLGGGDRDQLRFHVGHLVEVSGPLSVDPSAQGGGAGANATPTLTIQSLTYLSAICGK